ncbi:hypothetical protein FRB95_010613 [Tulasnella sp. JGI-2019a]|nr:hypothetical protein FRB95_010613 [Tulasnella sp. JGI-2019a]
MPPDSSNSNRSSVVRGPSPAKRPRLIVTSSFDGPSSSSTRTTAAPSSKSTPVPRSGTSTAGTPFGDDEYNSARRASVNRVLSVWNKLEQRYARAMDEDDIVDLRTGKLVQDCGVLKGRDKPYAIGKLLGEGDPSNVSSDTGEGEDEGEDGDEDGGEDGTRRVGRDKDKDELLFESDVDEEGEQADEPQDGGEEEDSEDELGEWDTVPAPPTPETSEPPTGNATPEETEALNPATDDAVSFLYSNVRPRLERLAREREESPLPSEDLAAFMAAESSLKARDGYVEPDGDDGDDVVFLGYGKRGTEDEEDEGVSSEGYAELDTDRGRAGRRSPTKSTEEEVNVDGGEDSEDDLTDWPTIPAPPSDEDSDEDQNEDEDEDDAGDDFSNQFERGLTPEPAASKARKSRSRSPVQGKSTSRPRVPQPTKASLPTPPYSHRSNGSPQRQEKDVTNLKMKRKGKGKEQATEAQVAADIWSSPEKSGAKQTILPLSSASTPTKRRDEVADTTTTLTPTLRRLMRQQDSPTKTPSNTRKGTPSRSLVPEVVVPSLRSLSLSPTKKKSAVPAAAKKANREHVAAHESHLTVKSNKPVPSDLERPVAATVAVTSAKPVDGFRPVHSNRKRKRVEGDVDVEMRIEQPDDSVDIEAERVSSMLLQDRGEFEERGDDELDVIPPQRFRYSSPIEGGQDLQYDDGLEYDDEQDPGEYHTEVDGFPERHDHDDGGDDLSRDYGDQQVDDEDYGPIASSSMIDPGPHQLRQSPRRNLASTVAKDATHEWLPYPPTIVVPPSHILPEPSYPPVGSATNVPMGPQPPVYQNPLQAQLPPNMLPRLPSFGSGANPDALLSQVLYSLNYLAYQNAVNTAASNFVAATGGSRAAPSPQIPAFPGMAGGGIFPPMPQIVQGYQTQPPAPIPPAMQPQQYMQPMPPVQAPPMSPERSTFDSSRTPLPSPRSILRNGSTPRPMTAPGTPSRRNESRSRISYQVSSHEHEHSGKGKARQDDRSDSDVFGGNGRGSMQNLRGDDGRRGQSVTFSASSSAIGEMSRRRRILDEEEPSGSHDHARGNNAGYEQPMSTLPPLPTRLPTKGLNTHSSRSPRTPAGVSHTAPRQPHPLRDSFQAPDEPIRKSLTSQRSLPNIAEGRLRVASDASTTFGSGSTAVLAKARAALSNSVARTSTLGISRSESTKRL